MKCMHFIIEDYFIEFFVCLISSLYRCNVYGVIFPLRMFSIGSKNRVLRGSIAIALKSSWLQTCAKAKCREGEAKARLPPMPNNKKKKFIGFC